MGAPKSPGQPFIPNVMQNPFKGIPEPKPKGLANATIRPLGAATKPPPLNTNIFNTSAGSNMSFNKQPIFKQIVREKKNRIIRPLKLGY